jgi:hypothetical protein
MICKLKGRTRKHEDVGTNMKHGDLVSVLRVNKYAILMSTGSVDQLWLTLNWLISQLWGQMDNYSMPKKSPGTMTQMIPIRFNQRLHHLEYKKVKC